jgi:hypothetical protein
MNEADYLRQILEELKVFAEACDNPELADKTEDAIQILSLEEREKKIAEMQA